MDNFVIGTIQESIKTLQSDLNRISSGIPTEFKDLTDVSGKWTIDSSGDIIPENDNTVSLGSASQRIKSIYVSDGSIYIIKKTQANLVTVKFQLDENNDLKITKETYNSVTDLNINNPSTTGPGISLSGGAQNINDLTDVSITDDSEKIFLKRGEAGTWVNSLLTTGDITDFATGVINATSVSLNDLTDVSITDDSEKIFLKRGEAGTWVNSLLTTGDITDFPFITTTTDKVAIGYLAGQNSQGQKSVAIGYDAGNSEQGEYSVAIGVSSGTTSQGLNSVAIGPYAGKTKQGEYSIAIGNQASESNEAYNVDRYIVLNAQTTALNPMEHDAFYVKPIRQDTNANKLLYNSDTGEITYQQDVEGVPLISLNDLTDVTLTGRALVAGDVLKYTSAISEGGHGWVSSTITSADIADFYPEVDARIAAGGGVPAPVYSIISPTLPTTLSGSIIIDIDFTKATISGTDVEIDGNTVGTTFGTGVQVSEGGGISTTIDSYVNLNSFAWTENFTIEFYCNMPAYSGTQSGNSLFASFDTVSGGQEADRLSIGRAGTSNGINFTTTNADAIFSSIHVTNASVPGFNGTWGHIVLTHDSSQMPGAQKQLYVNGVRFTDVSDFALSNVPVTYTAGTRNNYWVGRTYDNTDNGVENLKIFRVYNRILTDVEVATLYQSYAITNYQLVSNNATGTETKWVVSPHITTSEDKVAIGYDAGTTSQGLESVAIGNRVGNNNQGDNSIAIGTYAAEINQGSESVALGWHAGRTSQGSSSIAIGVGAAPSNQGGGSVAIGASAGHTSQDQRAIAIGRYAGYSNQGAYSIAIGEQASMQNIGNFKNYIILNAKYEENAATNALNPSHSNAFYVKPIRQFTNVNKLLYNADTGEITYQQDALDDLTNVTITQDNDKKFLKYGESGWANSEIVPADITNFPLITATTDKVAIGNNAGGDNQGLDSIAIGNSAIAHGNGSIVIGQGAQNAIGNWDVDNSIVIGKNARGNGANTITLGDSSHTLYLPGYHINFPVGDPNVQPDFSFNIKGYNDGAFNNETHGRLELGFVRPPNDFTPVLTIMSTTNTVDPVYVYTAWPMYARVFRTTSDDRIKSNEKPITQGVSVIEQLQPKIYDKHQNHRVPADKEDNDLTGVDYVTESGFVAQDVDKIEELKHLVQYNDLHDIYSLNYTGIIPYLVQSIKELNARIKVLESK